MTWDMAKMQVKCALLRNHSQTVQRNKEKELELVREENEKLKVFIKYLTEIRMSLGEVFRNPCG